MRNGHFAAMKIHISRFRSGPEFDMTPDGQFVEPSQPRVSEKLLRYAILLAVIAGLAAVAALALWLTLILIPVAAVAAAIAYGAFRWRMWRLGRSAGPPFRPPFQG